MKYKRKRNEYQMTNHSSLKEQLLQLEEKLLKPEIRKSKDKLSKLLADPFFLFRSSGKVLYKDEDISEMTLGEVRMTLSDFEIHPLSEEIILTTCRIDNEVNEQHSLRSSIWKIVDGNWKMHFHQGTKTQSE